MANNLSAFSPEIWASRIQENLHKTLVAEKICDFGMQAQLTEGDKINRPYIGSLDANTYVDASGVTVQSIAPTNEYLEVTTTKESTVYIQQKDLIQNKYDTAREYQDEQSYALMDDIDQVILKEVTNAESTVSNATLGGSAGAITPAVTNVVTIASKIRVALLTKNAREKGDFFWVVNPTVGGLIEEKAVGSGFSVADAAFKNGYAGTFLGFHIYISNNCYNDGSDTLMLAGQKGCVDLVTQKKPGVLVTQPNNKIGKNYIVWDLYGYKTFKKGAERMVKVQID